MPWVCVCLQSSVRAGFVSSKGERRKLVIEVVGWFLAWSFFELLAEDVLQWRSFEDFEEVVEIGRPRFS